MSTRALLAFKRHRFSLPWLVIKKSLASYVRIETLVVFRRALAAQDLPRAAAGARVVAIDDASSGVFRQLCAKYHAKNFQERLGIPGRCCYVAVRDDAIAGYAWVSHDGLYVDEIACVYPLAEGEIFIYDCFVDDASRGHGIYPAMLRAILADYAQRRDIQTAVIAAASVNHASIRGIQKAGFTEWKRIHYLEWGNRQHWWGLDAGHAGA